MKYLLWIYLSIFPSLAWAAQEPLEVILETQSKRKRICIAPIEGEEGSWSFKEELREVLQFDLEAGGCFRPIQDTVASTLADCHTFQIPYCVTWKWEGKKLTLTCTDLTKKKNYHLSTSSLSGSLDEDRREIHRLADRIYELFLGKKGVASMQILFAKRTSPFAPQRSSEIWICDSDGLNGRQLTSDHAYSVSPIPFAIRGSTSFLYVSYKEGAPKLYLFDPQTKKGNPYLSLRGNQILPSLSPRQNLLAFISDAAGRADLFVQSLSPQGIPMGKPTQLFSRPNATQASPTFSPDGKKIAFVSDQEGPAQIYVLDLSKKNQKPSLLIRRTVESTSPQWSPDGKKLAYSSKIEGVRQIWVFDFETQTNRPITQGPEMKENPVWAPNSLDLIYNTESHEGCELYRIHIEDPTPTRISKGGGHKRFPFWISSETAKLS